MKKLILFFSIVFLLMVSCPYVVLAGNNDGTYIQNGVISQTVHFSQDNDIKWIQPVSAYINRLYNYPDGYALEYPNNMWVDDSLSAIKTVIADNGTQIEIYRDNFNNTVHNANGYISYSNKFIKCPDNYVQMDKNVVINGMQTHLLQWQRVPLTTVANDKNYYLSAEYIKNSQEVYTVFIKSSSPVDRFMPLINSFAKIEAQGTARINGIHTFQTKGINEETALLYKNYFGPDATLRWGIFENSALVDMSYLKNMESKLDYSFDFVVWYKALGTDFPAKELETAYNNHKCVELTLQYPLSANLTYDILNGKYDAYLRSYAVQLKNFKHPVLFRLNNEMNGDWCSYSSIYTSKDTELFKAVWRHTYDIFQQVGVNNALWVFNPNDNSFPGFKWNNALNYFPGDAYVDIIGLTGYNTGTYYKGEVWREFDSIYRPVYTDYSNAFKYPFMITEFGCNSVGGDKIQWLQAMFADIGSFNNIKVAIWFNGTDLDGNGNPARIYRIDENETILQTFKDGLKQFQVHN
jgi:mannan endo-1,4-beta-mannosidase